MSSPFTRHMRTTPLTHHMRTPPALLGFTALGDSLLLPAEALGWTKPGWGEVVHPGKERDPVFLGDQGENEGGAGGPAQGRVTCHPAQNSRGGLSLQPNPRSLSSHLLPLPVTCQEAKREQPRGGPGFSSSLPQRLCPGSPLSPGLQTPAPRCPVSWEDRERGAGPRTGGRWSHRTEFPPAGVCPWYVRSFTLQALIRSLVCTEPHTDRSGSL